MPHLGIIFAITISANADEDNILTVAVTVLKSKASSCLL